MVAESSHVNGLADAMDLAGSIPREERRRFFPAVMESAARSQ
jgi:hypothetical protein